MISYIKAGEPHPAHRKRAVSQSNDEALFLSSVNADIAYLILQILEQTISQWSQLNFIQLDIVSQFADLRDTKMKGVLAKVNEAANHFVAQLKQNLRIQFDLCALTHNLGSFDIKDFDQLTRVVAESCKKIE